MSNKYTLYMGKSCPFCIRVVDALASMNLPTIPIKDVWKDPEALKELVEATGRRQVPCLRIATDGNVTWLFESLDIIDYLRKNA